MEGIFRGKNCWEQMEIQIHYDYASFGHHLRLLKIHPRVHPFLFRWRRERMGGCRYSFPCA